MDFKDGFKKIRRSIVGVGLRRDPQYQIFGSGFVIGADGSILTNRHVLEPLLAETAGQRIGVRRGAAAFFFITAAPEGEIVAVAGMLAIDIIAIEFIPHKIEDLEQEKSKTFRGLKPTQIFPVEPPDIGVCKIEPKDLRPEALPLSPAEITDSAGVSEGDPVGILGFPQGLSMPVTFDTRQWLQLTPLLQTGVISGILPFPSVPKPDYFVLDMHVNSGSSGSPLFLNDGKVIGIVFATRRTFAPITKINKRGRFSESKNRGVFTSSALGLAIPSVNFPKEWIHETGKRSE